MQVKSDKEYVERLKMGDLSAFDALFHKYSEMLYAFALSITRNQYAAEDITQLVFMKVWEKRAQIKEHLSFKSFLFSVAYHETISLLRKEKSEKRRINEYLHFSISQTNETEQSVEFKNIQDIANQVIDQMPEKRKSIFRLSRDQGYTNKEISEKLNISIKTVENQMTSALSSLRQKLGKQDIMEILYFFLILHP